MTVYLNRKPRTGPWGGANKVVSKLANTLLRAGNSIAYTLNHDNIDVIFCFDPRPNDNGEWYGDILEYKKKFNAKIIQRVGDLGTHGKPELTSLVKQSLPHSDYIIFPSDWAKDKIGYKKENCEIVNNAPLEVFHKFKKHKKLGKKVKLITHHWSTNPKKGFAFYKSLDKFVGENKDKFSFTYIGRIPDGFSFENTNYIEATGDNEFLAKKLSSADIYVTASREEAGANHVLEAMASGLPVVYHASGGSILNYCKPYGEEFVCERLEDSNSFLNAIDKIINSYSSYKNKVMKYDDETSKIIETYERIICNLAK